MGKKVKKEVDNWLYYIKKCHHRPSHRVEKHTGGVST